MFSSLLTVNEFVRLPRQYNLEMNLDKAVKAILKDKM